MSHGGCIAEDVTSGHLKFTSALVVDDAYDPLVPAGLDDQLRALDDAVAASENEDALRDELAAFGLDLATRAAAEPDALERLYAGTPKLTEELHALVQQHLFADVRSKRDQVTGIEDDLRALGLNVDHAGSEEPLPAEPPDIVLLDYYLGVASDKDARDQAVRKLQAIEAQYAARVPFIVLMSNRAVTVEARETFRADSDWVAGMFDFKAKQDLLSGGLGLHLLLWEMVLPYRRHIYAFVKALDDSTRTLVDRFMSRARSLGLEDYAFLQRLQLAEDGQPLGEYMLWLFGSLLPHLAFDNDARVKTTREQLDRVYFDTVLPADWLPSTAVAESYRLAISTPAVSPIAPHPLNPPGSEQPLPYVQFGDLLSNSSPHVWLIASPACDIAFAPGSDRDDPNRYVVLVPGELKPIAPHAPAPDRHDVVTPLFERDGQPYRIHWRPTRPVYVKHGEFAAWQAAAEVERTARLHVAYALDVQQAFAGHLTRIGMPVPPSMPFEVVVRIYREGPAGEFLEVDAGAAAGARLYVLRQTRRAQLNYYSMIAIIKALTRAEATWSAKLETLRHPSQLEQVKATLAQIAALRADSAKCRAICTEIFDLPAGQGHSKIADGLVQVVCDQQLSGRFPQKAVLIVNIHSSLGITINDAATDRPPATTTEEDTAP